MQIISSNSLQCRTDMATLWKLLHSCTFFSLYTLTQSLMTSPDSLIDGLCSTTLNIFSI